MNKIRPIGEYAIFYVSKDSCQGQISAGKEFNPFCVCLEIYSVKRNCTSIEEIEEAFKQTGSRSVLQIQAEWLAIGNAFISYKNEFHLPTKEELETLNNCIVAIRNKILTPYSFFDFSLDINETVDNLGIKLIAELTVKVKGPEANPVLKYSHFGDLFDMVDTLYPLDSERVKNFFVGWAITEQKAIMSQIEGEVTYSDLLHIHAKSVWIGMIFYFYPDSRPKELENK